jgi:hypothetical protein
VSTLNSKTFNRVHWNWPGVAFVPSSPLHIDERSFPASWVDSRTFSASWIETKSVQVNWDSVASFPVSWIDNRTFEASWIDSRTFQLASYGMTKTGVKIKGIVIGDAFRVSRTYTGLPTGATIAKAYLTIKKSTGQADSAALLQKSITTTLSASGQITDALTSSDGQIALYFDVSETESANAKPIDYVYDISVELSTGETHTLEMGTISFIKGVTLATS